MANVAEFNDTNFETEVLNSSDTVLVDFWAPWCGPCRMIAPVVEQLASENAGKFKIGKLNTDESPQTAMKYDVSAIPTLMIFKGGRVVQTFQGVQPKSRLQQALDQVSA